VDIAGLGDALGMGNWTVFAPTNAAFDALPEELLDAALNNTVLLTDILLFHAVEDVVDSSMLECSELVTMANGQDSRTVCRGGGGIYQKGGSNDRAMMPRIATTDIKTCQGYIHVIEDIIMLPANLVTE
jgi:transforming growth factor-beta-induced protein